MCAGLILGGIAPASLARADEAECAVALQINQANDLLHRGDVDAAIRAYHEAQDHVPQRPDLSYNLAVAQYRKGDLAAAEQSFRLAAANDNDSLAAKARYNLGNCDYASALKIAKSDQAGAIKGLNRAIANYRSTLDIDPTDTDARANLELAATLSNKLRQRQQEQHSQQKQPQQNKQEQQQSDRQPQQQQGQQNDARQAQPSQKPQSSPSSSNGGQNHNSARDNQEQQKSAKGSDQTRQNSTDSQRKRAEKEAKRKDEPRRSEAKDQNKPQSTNAAEDSTNSSNRQNHQSLQQQTSRNHQRHPATDRDRDNSNATGEANEQQGKTPPKGALSAASKPAEQANNREKQEAIDLDAASDGAMTRQEAEKMLQAIRDRDLVHRLQRQAAERARRVPVDRDW